MKELTSAFNPGSGLSSVAIMLNIYNINVTLNSIKRTETEKCYSLERLSIILNNWRLFTCISTMDFVLSSNILPPYISKWKNGGFFVVTRINKTVALINDPKCGKRRLPIEDLKKYSENRILFCRSIN